MTSKPPKCDYCKIKLICKESKSRHQKHCKERPDYTPPLSNSICDNCDKKFTRKDALNAHTKLCKGPKQTLTCTDCLKTFKRKHHFDAHLQMHARNSQKCSTCGREFKRKDFFNKHTCIAPVPEADVSSTSTSKRRKCSQHEN